MGDRIEAARDLSKASQRLYGKLAGIQLQAAYMNKQNSKAIASYSKKSQAAIRVARTSLNARLNTLTNVVASNARKVEAGFEVLTGVIRSHRTAAALDRKLIRQQTKSMGQDMQKSIARAIMIGEAKARRVADRARGNLARAKRAMLIEISERVETAADNLFKTIQGSHQKIADNYLSLKAYAVTAGGKLKDYVVKGKGKNLSSLGDLLSTVSGLSAVKAVKAGVLAWVLPPSLPSSLPRRSRCPTPSPDQRSRERVHWCHQRCACPLADGSGQVPPP